MTNIRVLINYYFSKDFHKNKKQLQLKQHFNKQTRNKSTIKQILKPHEIIKKPHLRKTTD